MSLRFSLNPSIFWLKEHTEIWTAPNSASCFFSEVPEADTSSVTFGTPAHCPPVCTKYRKQQGQSTIINPAQRDFPMGTRKSLLLLIENKAPLSWFFLLKSLTGSCVRHSNRHPPPLDVPRIPHPISKAPYRRASTDPTTQQRVETSDQGNPALRPSLTWMSHNPVKERLPAARATRYAGTYSFLVGAPTARDKESGKGVRPR